MDVHGVEEDQVPRSLLTYELQLSCIVSSASNVWRELANLA